MVISHSFVNVYQRVKFPIPVISRLIASSCSPGLGRLLIPEKHIALTQRIASFTAGGLKPEPLAALLCGKANHKTFQTFMKLGIPLVIDQLSIYSVWCVKSYSKALFVSQF